jgi:hypothetical protein
LVLKGFLQVALQIIDAAASIIGDSVDGDSFSSALGALAGKPLRAQFFE